MILSVFILVLSVFALSAALAVGWKARKAHRGLWTAFESFRKQCVVDEIQERKLWQRCYGRLLATRQGVIDPVILTAQHAEDVFLVDYFEGFGPGVFVEIGAYDGIQFSNTYALEQLGWTGLLIEAHPENVERCRKNRPRSIVEHYAIGGPDASGTALFNMVIGRGGDLLSALSPDADHLCRCLREGEGIRQISVPCIGLGQLLKLHQLPHIDFLSIDIEGGEIEALRGMDFERLRPRLVLLEANGREALEALHAFMQALSYRTIRQFGVNVLFEDQRAKARSTSGSFSCESLS